MTTTSTDHTQAKLQGNHSHGFIPATDKADRPRSFELADFPVPNGREEDWRFTPLARIKKLLDAELAGPAPEINFDGRRIDGEFASKAGDLPFQLVVDNCECVGAIGAPTDRTAVVAWANRKTPTCLTVTESPAHPLVFDIVGSGAGSEATAQHLTINIADRVAATIVLRHTGSAQLTQTVELMAGVDSEVTVVSTQEWDSDAVHAAAHRIRAQHNAVVKHIVVTLGADLVRITTDVEFAGEGANVELLGLYFTDAGQHHEHRLFVDHRIPNCISNATYKGALQGTDAHSVWIGDVLIGSEASGTDTYELNRNLLLTEGSRADSVPNLEIETGEIEGAGHASATGRFDDEQLFYLMSRGVSEDLARRLIVRGFFAEQINRIGVPEVQDRLIAAIEAELDQTMAIIK